MGSSLDQLNEIWQSVFALDTQYNGWRSSTKGGNTTYLCRRGQLSRKQLHSATDVSESIKLRKEYLKLRSYLLVSRFGKPAPPPIRVQRSRRQSETSSYDPRLAGNFRPGFQQRSSHDSPPSIKSGPAWALDTVVEKESVSKGYAFSGINRIFDHHSKSITRIRFPHNDSTRLAVTSADGAITICNCGSYATNQASSEGSQSLDYVELQAMAPSRAAVMDLAWSQSNDFLLSVSLDGAACLWNMADCSLARFFPASVINIGGLLVCDFLPINNNFFAVGGTRGVLQIMNMSTGKAVKEGKDVLHAYAWKPSSGQTCTTREQLSELLGKGCITALTFESRTGACLWVGTDQGLIRAYVCHSTNGKLIRSHQLQLSSAFPDDLGPVSRQGVSAMRHRRDLFAPSVTSLSARSWLCRQDGSTYLLANAAGLGLLLFKVLSADGRLGFMRKFDLAHRPPCSPPLQPHGLRLQRSCFAPLISFRCAACAVSACEDGNVYVYELLAGGAVWQPDVTSCVTYFQGHIGAVVDVGLSWDESVMASADESGTVILWRRQQQPRTEA